MKKLLLIIVTAAMFYSCSDDDNNFSAIEQLVGEWALQIKTVNNMPRPIENKNLYFSEDNNFRDFKGNYELVTDDTTSGAFQIDTQYANLIFTSNTETTSTYRFFLNNISMVLTWTDDNGDENSDTWVKTVNYNYDE